MRLLRPLSFWLEVTVTERLMWLRYRKNRKKYETTRMWQKIGDQALPAGTAYEQVKEFVRETVNLAPRPYGKGAYSLIVAAAWKQAGREGQRWQRDFTYQEREDTFAQLAEYMASWGEPAPRVIVAGVLSYGALIKEGL